MKVLFVSGGNSTTGISSIVRSQGDSLTKLGLDIDYFQIRGKGFVGYMSNIGSLHRKIKSTKYDVVHAHFSFSGFVAALAGARPLVASLMGWNVRKPLLRKLIKVFNRVFWNACIVKSAGMLDSLRIKDLILLPNGVDLELFRPMDQQEARSYLGWSSDVKHVLFAANPSRPIKDFALAQQAFELLLQKRKAELHCLQDIRHTDMPYVYNAADVVLLTSKAEGSPNVIKEAMACNCVIVSTDVGDVRERFGNNAACFICNHNAASVCDTILQALAFPGVVDTRSSVLALDSRQVAQRLIDIYQGVLVKH